MANYPVLLTEFLSHYGVASEEATRIGYKLLGRGVDLVKIGGAFHFNSKNTRSIRASIYDILTAPPSFQRVVVPQNNKALANAFGYGVGLYD